MQSVQPLILAQSVMELPQLVLAGRHLTAEADFRQGRQQEAQQDQHDSARRQQINRGPTAGLSRPVVCQWGPAETAGTTQTLGPIRDNSRGRGMNLRLDRGRLPENPLAGPLGQSWRGRKLDAPQFQHADKPLQRLKPPPKFWPSPQFLLDLCTLFVIKSIKKVPN